VISDSYWARRFGRSADALGRTIHLNRVPVTIVGVNAPGFNGPKAGGTPEVFLPVSLQHRLEFISRGSLLAKNDFSWLMIMGRLKPGVTDQEATGRLALTFRNAVHSTIPDLKDSDIPRL
jgi:hypothetical protein